MVLLKTKIKLSKFSKKSKTEGALSRNYQFFLIYNKLENHGRLKAEKVETTIFLLREINSWRRKMTSKNNSHGSNNNNPPAANPK